MDPRSAALALAAALTGLGAVVAVPRPADAQIPFERERLRGPPPGPPRLDLSFGIGTIFSTDWSDQVILETQDPTGARTTRLLMPEVGMAPGRALAGGVTYWRGPLGVRFHAGFARACLTAGETRCDAAPEPETATRFVTGLDVWSYGVQGVVGLTRGRQGRIVRPFLLVGAAGVTLDPDAPVPAPGQPEAETVPSSGSADVVVIDGTTNLVITMDRLGFETRLAGDLGAGLDLRLPLGPHGIGIRLELVDRLMMSPLGVRITRLGGGIFGGTSTVEPERPLVHTIHASVAVLLDLGLPSPPPPTVSWAPR